MPGKIFRQMHRLPTDHNHTLRKPNFETNEEFRLRQQSIRHRNIAIGAGAAGAFAVAGVVAVAGGAAGALVGPVKMIDSNERTAEPNDWTKSSLLGRVRTAHADSAALANNAGEWIEEPRVPIRTTRYHEAGYIVKELFFALDGQVSKVGFTKYDSDWNKTEILVQNPNGGLLSLLVCEYDDKGHELGSVLTSAPGLITRQKSIPVYDQAGNKVEESWFWEDGTPGRKHAYKYSEDGRLSEQVTRNYAEHGSVEEKWVSRYSEAGHLTQTFCLNADDQLLIGRTTYEYDERGNEREVAAHNINGDLYSMTSYTYVFDSVGNWIKRTEEFKTNQSGFETRNVAYRTLTYY